MKLGDYSAVITSNDSRLTEYQTQITHSGRMATCWVASNEGQRFGVNCALAQGRDTLRIRLLADGVLLDKRIADRMHHCCLSGNRLSSREKRPFEFAKGVVPIEEFDPSDSDEASDSSSRIRRKSERDKEMWSERGTITVELYRVKVEYGALPPPEEHKYYASASQGLHTIRVGKTEHSHRAKLRNITRVDPLTPADENPFVVFKFKHRPRQWLEMYGIIPKEEQASEVDGVDDAGEAERRAEAMRAAALATSAEGRKRRRSPTPVFVKKLARLGMRDSENEKLDEDSEHGSDTDRDGDADGERRSEDLDDLSRDTDTRDEEGEEQVMDEEQHEENGFNMADLSAAIDPDPPSPSPSSSRLSVKVEPGTPYRSPPPPASHSHSHSHTPSGLHSAQHGNNKQGRHSFSEEKVDRAIRAANRARAVAGLGEMEDQEVEKFLMDQDGGDEDSQLQRQGGEPDMASGGRRHSHPYVNSAAAVGAGAFNSFGSPFQERVSSSMSTARQNEEEWMDEGRDADGRSPHKRRRSGLAWGASIGSIGSAGSGSAIAQASSFSDKPRSSEGTISFLDLAAHQPQSAFQPAPPHSANGNGLVHAEGLSTSPPPPASITPSGSGPATTTPTATLFGSNGSGSTNTTNGTEGSGKTLFTPASFAPPVMGTAVPAAGENSAREEETIDMDDD